MSRSGYSDNIDSAAMNLWTGTVTRALRGKRGQALLSALRDALDAMPEKRLVANELIRTDGEVCALGCLARHRGMDVSDLDPHSREDVADTFDIAPALAAEIVYENDEGGPWRTAETPEERWTRVRNWVEARIATPERPRVHR
jgi:hypothetical protein